jgi:dTMP kinase
MFIVFEGLDGVGKTTQAKRLRDYYLAHGRQVVFTREPGGGGDFCLKLREVMLSHKTSSLSDLFLIYSARNEHIVNTIIPALNDGKIVICDRFFYSSIAYFCYESGWKNSKEREIVNYFQSLMPKIRPDLCLIFDCDTVVLNDRINIRSDANKLDLFDLETKNKIRNCFIDLAKTGEYSSKIIDSSRDIDTIFNDVLKCCQDLEK